MRHAHVPRRSFDSPFIYGVQCHLFVFDSQLQNTQEPTLLDNNLTTTGANSSETAVVREFADQANSGTSTNSSGPPRHLRTAFAPASMGVLFWHLATEGGGIDRGISHIPAPEENSIYMPSVPYNRFVEGQE